MIASRAVFWSAALGICLCIVAGARASSTELADSSAAQCVSTDGCPAFWGTAVFDVGALHLLPVSDLFLREVTKPFRSPVFRVQAPDVPEAVGGTRLWQIRTVAVAPAASGGADGMRHYIVPFLLSTAHPHTFLSDGAVAMLKEAGAQQHERTQLALCNVHLGLPVQGNTSCARQFSPSNLMHTRDPRKNVLGSLDAAAVIATSALLRSGAERAASLTALGRMFPHTSDSRSPSLAEEYDLQRDMLQRVSPDISADAFLAQLHDELAAFPSRCDPDSIAGSRDGCAGASPVADGADDDW